MVGLFKMGFPCGRSAASMAILLVMCSCATLNVPAVPPQFNPKEMLCINAPGVELSVKAIEGRDNYWSLFDDDLPQAGIGAIWVSVKNVSDSEIDLSKLKWVLRRGGTDEPALDGDQVFKLYYRARHIQMYGIETDRRAKLALEKIRFQAGRIRPRMVREGFLFFRVAPASAQDWVGNGILRAENVRLTEGRTSSLQVHFAYANP